MKGVLLGCFVGLVVPVQMIFILHALAVLVGPVQNIFLPHTISLHLFSTSSKLGRLSCRVACLLVCVSGFFLGFSYFQLSQNQMCKQTCQQYKYTVYIIHLYHKQIICISVDVGTAEAAHIQCICRPSETTILTQPVGTLQHNPVPGLLGLFTRPLRAVRRASQGHLPGLIGLPRAVYQAAELVRQVELYVVSCRAVQMALQSCSPSFIGQLTRDGILDGFFSQGFWAQTRVFSDSSFYLVFYPCLPALQNAIHEWTRVLLFRGFCVWIFKNKVEYGFL